MTKDINLGYFGDNQEESILPRMFDLECPRCKNNYSDESIHLAVFLYGFFCLHRKDVNYIGITCPSCLATILTKGSQSHTAPFSWLTSNVTFGPLTLDPPISYFSSIYHYPLASQSRPDLRDLNINFFHTTISEGWPDHLEDQLNDHVTSNSLENHLCSFDPSIKQSPPVDLFVLYVDEQDLEKLVKYEVENEIQIIPRYRHHLNLLSQIESFVAHRGFDKIADRLIEPAKANLEILECVAKEKNLNIEKLLSENPNILTPDLVNFLRQNESEGDGPNFDREADFMNILSADPNPWDLSGTDYEWIKAFWKAPYPFKDQEIPLTLTNLKPFQQSRGTAKSHKEMVTDIEPVFAKGYVQKYLSTQYRNFIREYSRIATRHAFSYADVWVLKERYLEKVYQCVQAKKATRPAFNHRETCRQIAREKWEKDPEITIADMVRCDEISLVRGNDELYPEETLRKWIKDLCPNRKPGRRPKKKKK